MPDPLTILFEHVCRTLPDSLSARAAILHALDDVLAEDHPAKQSVRAQITALQTLETLQAELPLKFQTEAKP